MGIVHTINLSHRKDRLLSIATQAKEQGFALKIWEGVYEGKMSITRDNINKSFRKIVQFAKDNEEEYVIIAEDDCIFHSSFSFDYYIEKIPEDFDIYLGMIYSGQENEEHRIMNGYAGNTLICIHNRFYDFFLSMPTNVHVDHWLGNFAYKFKYYVCYPYICKQLNGYSDNKKRDFNYDVYLEGKTFL